MTESEESHESVFPMPRPWSPAEAAHLMEIQQKIYFYGWCIDHRRFDDLDDLFTVTPEAIVHYDVPNGVRLPWPEMKQWLPKGLEIFRLTQHNMSNPMIALEDGTARSRTYGQLIHLQERTSGEITVMRHYASYHDEWHEQRDGWRIASRRLVHLHMDGDFFQGDEVVPYRQPRPL